MAALGVLCVEMNSHDAVTYLKFKNIIVYELLKTKDKAFE